MRSGKVQDKRESILSIPFHADHTDSISFRFKVSSEKDFDFLECTLDDSLVGQWSGLQDWSSMKLPIEEGEHLISWNYSKDRSMSDGEDAAWIDDVLFPIGAFSRYDLALMDMEVHGPEFQHGDEVQLKFRIRNTSLQVVDSFTLSLALDGNILGSTRYTFPLLPQEEILLPWLGDLGFSTGGTFLLEAEVKSLNDSFYSNNHLSRKVDLTGLPHSIESKQTGSMKVFPNPSSGEIHILFTDLAEVENHLSLLDVQGRVVRSFQLQGSRGHMLLSLGSLKGGLYFLRLEGSSTIVRLVLCD